MKNIMIVILLAACTVGYARIGETEEQCNTRYGKPIMDIINKNTIHYRKNDVKIFVIFHERVCQKIRYTNYTKAKLTVFTDDHIIKLLEVNKTNKFNPKGKKFREFTDLKTVGTVWYAGEENKIFIKGEFHSFTFTITTLNYISWKIKQAEKKKRDKLKGF